MTVLSASLPPLKYRMTRFRRLAPCARARSEMKAGAAHVIVNAETPPRMKSLRVVFTGGSSRELVVGGPGKQMHGAAGLVGQLCIRTGPRAAGANVIDERVVYLDIRSAHGQTR